MPVPAGAHDRLLELRQQVVAFCASRVDVQAVLLVGSWARRAAKPSSDIDLVWVVDGPGSWLGDRGWVAEFGHVEAVTHGDFGPVQSLFVRYRHPPVVEHGVAGRGWLELLEHDRPTQQVVAQGAEIWWRRSDVRIRVPRADVATHYFLPQRGPFRSLSDVPEAAREEILEALQADAEAGRTHRRFGRRYMALRQATEDRLREAFVARGGRPERRHPHYFVLGTSRWFEGLSPDLRSVVLPLDHFPSEVTSVTWPDSFVAMGEGVHFGLPHVERPTSGRVYRVDEVPELLASAGWPDDVEDHEGYVHRDFVRYIEVQLWSDAPVIPWLHRPQTR